VIFAPILLFVYQTFNIGDDIITTVTVATSLFCTFFASLGSSYQHYRKGHVIWPFVIRVGLMGAVFVFLTSNFVTTQEWYSKNVFRLVFGTILVLVALRMLLSKKESSIEKEDSNLALNERPFWKILTTSALAGTVSAAAGVGGGVVLVPSYNKLIKIPLINAVATSSATISITTFFGILTYVLMGYQSSEVLGILGWVDYKTGLLLAIPAIFCAQIGAKVAQRIDRKQLRRGFSLLALVVAARLLWSALSSF